MTRASSPFVAGWSLAWVGMSVAGWRTKCTSAVPLSAIPQALRPGPRPALHDDRFALADGTLSVSAGTGPAEPAAARTRALLDAALESSADALLVTDEAGRPEAGNRRFLALFGLAPGDLAAGEPAAFRRRMASRCRDADAVAARLAAIDASSDLASDAIELVDGRRFECFAQPV